MLPIRTTAGLLRTDLNFDAENRDLYIILTHTYFQSDRDSRRLFSTSTKQNRQDRNATLCLPNHIPVRDADWFKCHFRQLYFKADWSEIHFLSKLSLSSPLFTWFTRTKKCSAAKSGENIIVKEERSFKSAEKNPSVTVVASVCSTGATE